MLLSVTRKASPAVPNFGGNVVFRYFFDKGIGTMTTSGYDDIQMRFFAEPSAYQTIDTQRMFAEAQYMRAKELARLVRLARAWVAGVVRAWLLAPAVRWYRRRKTYQELMRLDDRTLADIGILRCDIPQVVRNAYAPRTAPAETPAAGATVHRLSAGGKSSPAQSDDTDRSLAA
jgi:uncharacterized protein YjiS (DUF1127 family)